MNGWDDISVDVEVPETDVLEAAAVAPAPKPTPKPAKTKKPQQPAAKAVKDQSVIGYLTRDEMIAFDSELDGRPRAGVVRRLVLEWMEQQ